MYDETYKQVDTEWEEGFEAGRKYAAKEQELIKSFQEFMAVQPVNSFYEDKANAGRKKIAEELSKFKQELMQEYETL